MTEIMNIVGEKFTQYVGNGRYFILFLISLVFLMLAVRKQFRQRFLIYYIIAVAIIFACPVTAYVIMTYFIGKSVYWRMLWLLPITLTIALAGTFLITKFRKKALQMLALAVLTAALVFSGDYMYRWNDFTENINIYKLPDATFQVCDTVLDLSDGEQVKAVFPNELVCYVRQYTGKITMPYGRWAVYRQSNFPNRKSRKLYYVMNDPAKTGDVLTKWAYRTECDYIVVRKDDNVNNTMSGTRYQAVADTESYVIYKMS